MRLVKTGWNAVSPEQQISAREFVQDTRSGMTVSELLEKYKLSPNRLQRLFRALIDLNIMTIDELFGRHALFDHTVQHGIQSVRLLFRHVVDFWLPIYEEENPKAFGIILDITEGGVGLKGIEAIIGESKNFRIPADRFFDVARVEFQARCCWVNTEESTSKCIAGFEITTISPGALVELRKLVQLIELADQAEFIEYDEPSPEKTDRRKQTRHTVGFRLPVYEATKRENKGIIVDVSKGGIRVKGIGAEPGERKTLVIPAYHGFDTFDAIVIVAECRWIGMDEEPGGRNSGFKVLQLKPRSANELAKLISTLVVR